MEKRISSKTKITIEWIANIVIEKFQDHIKGLEELKSDEETSFGDEENLISIYERWISEIAEAVDEVKKA